ncbi:MAG: Type IV-A pilus assembly ATPase PilB [Parcubacteria group bacterium GW2011_GWA2_43_11]|nr:MAG: Type IV-A pilus assembly ATPase PilB [Parcubacteria group bacterium GW2011_GWC2_42_11]KKS85015.1 MAG: Type IV-A pilus assembly ATPase PilB [Parcubacteria group bacterium GW2011_GWA2_43_11]
MGRYTTNQHSNPTYPPEQRRFVRKASDFRLRKGPEQELEEEYVEAPTPPTPAREKEGEEAQEIHQDALLFARGVLGEAIIQGASDVHFEPKDYSYLIRFRIDGVLHQYMERSIDEYEEILNALKVLGDMDIAEHATPQDGHIELVQEEVKKTATEEQQGEMHSTQHGMELGNKQHYFDIRVSVFPSVNGEVVVMRILNRENALITIDGLGMDLESLGKLREVLLTSYGMMLITGPTGSGKTTTLYSIMSELRSDEKNIITLEDPIEFHLSWLRQCEIREERGFTYEAAMASVLRQDPDVLMVGEIRDPQTAEHAVRSALVGRIVGSTIHANTAISTIARLIELGIPRSILAHTLNCIIAQRLVRRVCDFCKHTYTPSQTHLKYFGLEKVEEPFYMGKGCEKCKQTGFKGRTGIFSIMVFDDAIRNMLFEERPLNEIQDYAIENGMKTLKADAVLKILSGTTTIEEAVRVV